MGTAGDYDSQRRVPVPPSKPFLNSLQTNSRRPSSPMTPLGSSSISPLPGSFCSDYSTSYPSSNGLLVTLSTSSRPTWLPASPLPALLFPKG
ncbi:hypothetical protein V6N13_091064 [Hibiscus sabdariffa]